MKLAFILAMQSEYDHLLALLTDMKTSMAGPFECAVGHLNNAEIILFHAGIGKVNAAAATTALIHTFHPDRIISTGVAGGLDENIKIMDVVVSRSLVYHDMWCGPGTEQGEVQGVAKSFIADSGMVRIAMSLPTEFKIHAGLIVTGDQFITDFERKSEIKSSFPQALACDMESAAIAHVCFLYNVPFVSFRIISDTPGSDGHLQQWDDFWKIMAENSFSVTRTFIEQLIR